MPAYDQREVQEGSRTLWIGLLTGPVVYSVHFMVVYLLVEGACRTNLVRFNVLGLSGVAVAVLGLTLLAAGINAYAGLMEYREWQVRKATQGGTEGTYAPFMSLVGVWLNVLFAATILVTGAPALFLLPCRWS